MLEAEEKSKTVSLREPKGLTPEYHKAHKQAVLWSGILLVWELVGVDLDRLKAVGGNGGALVESLKSPKAVPWALLILVIYFLFKVTVEWYQCNQLRRSSRFSRADFFSAWIISLLAIGLYALQTIARTQLADHFQRSWLALIFAALLTLFSLFLLVGTRQYFLVTTQNTPKLGFRLMRYPTAGVTLLVGELLCAIAYWKLTAIGTVIGLLLFLLLVSLRSPDEKIIRRMQR
jgi:hypothetical protein